MDKNLVSRQELLSAVTVSESVLDEWEKKRIFRAVGIDGDQSPFYTVDTVVTVQKIQTMLELGYDLESIHKIIRRFGLPNGLKYEDTSSKPGKFLTVGALSEQVGVSTRTIKHWEDKGIIEPDMRTSGGFRLYRNYYIFFCSLIRDLQLFGYSLEEIKTVSDYFRDFISIQSNMENFDKKEVEEKLDSMTETIKMLFKKTDLLKKGIQRWEELLKKKRREITQLEIKNEKRETK